MNRRELVSGIIGTVYSRADTPEENERRIERVFRLAVRLELETETAPISQTPAQAPANSAPAHQTAKPRAHK